MEQKETIRPARWPQDDPVSIAVLRLRIEFLEDQMERVQTVTSVLAGAVGAALGGAIVVLIKRWVG